MKERIQAYRAYSNRNCSEYLDFEEVSVPDTDDMTLYRLAYKELEGEHEGTCAFLVKKEQWNEESEEWEDFDDGSDCNAYFYENYIEVSVPSIKKIRRDFIEEIEPLFSDIIDDIFDCFHFDCRNCKLVVESEEIESRLSDNYSAEEITKILNELENLAEKFICPNNLEWANK